MSNAGAPGVDGVTVDDLKAQCWTRWPRIRVERLRERYRLQAVRRLEIPKSDGQGKRMPGVRTVMDRMIQQALLQVLTRILDPTFSGCSYGVRPGRSAHQAVLKAKEHIAAGHRWVVGRDGELEKRGHRFARHADD